jgi:Spy/CpxP family protein refolding chaperone
MKSRFLTMPALLMVLLSASSLAFADDAQPAATAPIPTASAAPPPPAGMMPQGMPPQGVMMKGMGPSAMPCQKQPLSADKMKTLQAAMGATQENDKKLFDKLAELHEKRDAVLKAEKFNAKAFAGIEEQSQKIRDELHEARVKAFVKAVASFTPEEREDLGSMIDGMPRPPCGGMTPPTGGMPPMGSMPPHDAGMRPNAPMPAAPGTAPKAPAEADPAHD